MATAMTSIRGRCLPHEQFLNLRHDGNETHLCQIAVQGHVLALPGHRAFVKMMGKSGQVRMMGRIIVLETAYFRGVEIAVVVSLLDNIVGVIETQGEFKAESRAIYEYQAPFQVMSVIDQVVIFRKTIVRMLRIQNCGFLV
jgi:thiamine transporter ThiT